MTNNRFMEIDSVVLAWLKKFEVDKLNILNNDEGLQAAFLQNNYSITREELTEYLAECKSPY